MIDYEETKSQPITRVMVWQAYKKVKANKGSGGIDGMSWEYLDKNLKPELYKLWNRLTSGSYFPQPTEVRRTHALRPHRPGSSKDTPGKAGGAAVSSKFLRLSPETELS